MNRNVVVSLAVIAVLGLAFITEGAIPFAARNPLKVIPCLMIGSAIAGAISLGLDAGTQVPHGGIVNLLVPGAVSNVGAWALAIAVGTAVSAAALIAVMAAGARSREREQATAPAAAAVPA